MPIKHTPGGAKPVPGASGTHPSEETEVIPPKYPNTPEEWLLRSQGNQTCNILQCERCAEKFNYLGSPGGRRSEVQQVIRLPAILCGMCLDQASQSKAVQQEIGDLLKKKARF